MADFPSLYPCPNMRDVLPERNPIFMSGNCPLQLELYEFMFDFNPKVLVQSAVPSF